MLMTREQISQDKSFGALTEAILERDQARTADVFFGMVQGQGRSVGEALSIVMAAEAPFVQVPSHINVRDGQITLINNDHTILGLRTSVSLMPFVPEKYRLLPLLQSVWYIPAGLDIWNQLLAKYPGRYAMMKGYEVPPPDHGPMVWNEHQEPIVRQGTIEERLHEHLIATMSGDVQRSYGLFLGLAAEAPARPGAINSATASYPGYHSGKAGTPGTVVAARAITDLADFIGERAHGLSGCARYGHQTLCIHFTMRLRGADQRLRRTWAKASNRRTRRRSRTPRWGQGSSSWRMGRQFGICLPTCAGK
jgi:hypothetical protein